MFTLALKIGFALLVLVILFWAIPYTFKDCLRVGHTRTYCILDALH